MTRREPSAVAVLSARLVRAYPSLSAYSAASLADELCRIEAAQRAHAVRCCSGEDGGYVRFVLRCTECGEEWPCTGDRNRSSMRPALAAMHGASKRAVHDQDAEERAGKRIVRRLTEWKRKLGDLAARSPGEYQPDHAAWVAADLSTRIELHGDPRGRVLLLRLPGDAEAVSV